MAAQKSTPPDLSGPLGRFADCLAFLRAVRRSLEAREVAADEEASLRLVTEALQGVYNELDALI